MGRRPVYVVLYPSRRNWRAWAAGVVGVLMFIAGLSMGWNFLLSLLSGGGLAALVYAARF